MDKAIVLNESDIKKIIAEKFNIEEKDIIKNKYSYTVITEREEEK